MRETTRQRALAAIEVAIAAIQKDPAAPHTIQSLAKTVHLSPVRFHKLFRELMDEPVGEYVRRARLTKAIGLMRARRDTSLTEIALIAGFSELSDLSRVFKARFGLSPSQWDRVAPLNDDQICQAGVEGEGYLWSEFPKAPLPASWDIVVEPFPAMRLAGLRIANAHEASNLKDGFDRLESWLADAGQLNEDRCFMGLSNDDLLSTPLQKVGFDLAYPVDQDVKPSGRVFIRTIEAFEAATLHCQGGLEDYKSAWDTMHRKWLPPSPYVRAQIPAMEIYYNDPRAQDMAYWDMECVLPLSLATDE